MKEFGTAGTVGVKPIPSVNYYVIAFLYRLFLIIYIITCDLEVA